VTLTDTRDSKSYAAVKIGSYWVMAQNLNYQENLSWEETSASPSTEYDNASTHIIGSFWCPGVNDATASSQTDCDVWGALYTWNTAMSIDGKGSWTENGGSYCTGAANTAPCKLNWGRSDNEKRFNGRGICPVNWHVPTNYEWSVIFDTLEGNGSTVHQSAAPNASTPIGTNAGARAKNACYTNASDSPEECSSVTLPKWTGSNQQSLQSNMYGLSLIPAGNRWRGGSNYKFRATYAQMATSTPNYNQGAIVYGVSNVADGVWHHPYYRATATSVRCMRDTE
jgi:uncharacterized protein (TIGR02145 family)